MDARCFDRNCPNRKAFTNSRKCVPSFCRAHANVMLIIQLKPFHRHRQVQYILTRNPHQDFRNLPHPTTASQALTTPTDSPPSVPSLRSSLLPAIPHLVFHYRDQADIWALHLRFARVGRHVGRVRELRHVDCRLRRLRGPEV